MTAELEYEWTEKRWLDMIAYTDGMECPIEWFDDSLRKLIADGKVSDSGGRGPGGLWHRLEIIVE